MKPSVTFFRPTILLARRDMPVDFDGLADIYDSTRSAAPELVNRVAKGVRELLGKGSTLLDIGVGTGRFLIPITKLQINCYGLDISGKMLLNARAKGAVYLVRGDACSPPFRDDSFDGTMMVNLLHLVRDWKRLLHEAARVSRKFVISLDVKPDDRDPIRLFKDIIRQRKIEEHQLAPRENELAEICPPDSIITLGEYEERMDREEVFSALMRRSYSFQTEMDEELNRQCVVELESRLKGDPIISRRELELLVWKPVTISEFVERNTFCYPHRTTF